MFLFIPAVFLMVGVSVNDYSTGGVENFDHAIEKIESGFESIEPIDYSKMNG